MVGISERVPGGVRDIKRICERVACWTCDRMRTLLKMWKGRLEILEEFSIGFLTVESAQ
jgi:hypothetical protein